MPGISERARRNIQYMHSVINPANLNEALALYNDDLQEHLDDCPSSASEWCGWCMMNTGIIVMREMQNDGYSLEEAREVALASRIRLAYQRYRTMYRYDRSLANGMLEQNGLSWEIISRASHPFMRGNPRWRTETRQHKPDRRNTKAERLP